MKYKVVEDIDMKTEEFETEEESMECSFEKELMREIGRYKLLTAEEEVDIASAIHKGDKAAREK